MAPSWGSIRGWAPAPGSPPPGRPTRPVRGRAPGAAQPVVDLAHRHTTVSVERAVLRLAGLTGTDPVTGEGAAGVGGVGGTAVDRVPWANRVVDAVREQVGLESGV